MKKFYSILIILAIGCKDDDPVPVTDLLTRPANGWIRTSVIVTLPNTTQPDEVFDDRSVFRECDVDNVTIFKSDLTYSVQSTVKCSSGEPSTIQIGTWDLSSDGKFVEVNINGLIYPTKILEISEDQMKAEMPVVVGTATLVGTVTLKPN